MSSFQDKEIVCECGKPFIWNSGEQAFMEKLLQKGKIDKVNAPKRCYECRAAKKERFKEADERRALLRTS